MQWEQLRFFDFAYIIKIVAYVGIDYYFYLSLDIFLDKLKDVKKTYLQKKEQVQSLRDKYASKPDNPELKQKRNREQLKYFLILQK